MFHHRWLLEKVSRWIHPPVAERGGLFVVSPDSSAFFHAEADRDAGLEKELPKHGKRRSGERCSCPRRSARCVQVSPLRGIPARRSGTQRRHWADFPPVHIRTSGLIPSESDPDRYYTTIISHGLIIVVVHRTVPWALWRLRHALEGDAGLVKGGPDRIQADGPLQSPGRAGFGCPTQKWSPAEPRP